MCLGALGIIEHTWDEGGLPMASVNGEPVCLMYTPDAQPGDSVIAHLGFAVEIIDSKRAAQAARLRDLDPTTLGKESA